MDVERSQTYTKAVGLETMRLLIHLAFFDDTGPGAGRLTAGGAYLTEGELLDSEISSYRVPATTSGGGSAPAR